MIPEDAACLETQNLSEEEKKTYWRSRMGAPPDGNEIVAMIEHQGAVYVATTQRVYRLADGVFHPMNFVFQPEGIPVVSE